MGVVSQHEDILERFLEDVRQERIGVNSVTTIVNTETQAWLKKAYDQLANKAQRLVEITREPELKTTSRILSLEWENHQLTKDIARLQKEVARLKNGAGEKTASHENHNLRLAHELREAVDIIADLKEQLVAKNAAIARFRSTGKIQITQPKKGKGHGKSRRRRKGL